MMKNGWSRLPASAMLAERRMTQATPDTASPGASSDAWARAAGLVITLIAILALIGWNTHTVALKQASANFPPIAALSAVGLLLLGIGILLTASPLAIFGNVPAAALTLLGLVFSTYHLLGQSIGPRALFDLNPSMSLPCALANLFGGFALLVVGYSERNHTAYQLTTLLAFFALCIGVFGTAWYVLDHPTPDAHRMGLYAALSWILGAIALSGMAWGRNVVTIAINRKVFVYPIWLVLPALVAIILAYRDIQSSTPADPTPANGHLLQQAASDIHQLTRSSRANAASMAASRITRKLQEDLQNGTTSLAVYERRCQLQLADFQAMFPALHGLARLGLDGEVLFQVGMPSLAELPTLQADRQTAQRMSNPVHAEEDMDIYVSTPVLDSSGNPATHDLTRWRLPGLADLLNRDPRGLVLLSNTQGPSVVAFAAIVQSGDMVRVRENLTALPQAGSNMEIQRMEVGDETMQLIEVAPWYLAQWSAAPAQTEPSKPWAMAKLSTYLLAGLLLSVGLFFISQPKTRLVLPDSKDTAAHKLEPSRRLKAADDSDITALNTKLITTESEFRNAIMEAPFPIIIYSRNGTVLLLNKMWTHLSGYNRKDIPTLDDWLEKAYDLNGPANVDPMASGIHVNERASDQGNQDIRTKGGESRTWYFNSRMLSGEAAEDGKVISMAVDITETRQAQAELDQFFNLSIEMLCILTFDGHFKRVNPSIKEVLGYAEWELKDHALSEFVHEDDVPATEQLLKRMSEGEPTLYFENRFRTQDGQYRILIWSAYPDMKEGLIYAAARDVTEEKIAHDRLRKTTEALQQSNKELETFAYVASHDLREPLRTIGSFTELLAENYRGKLDAEADQYIKFIVEGAHRSQALIRALLDYSSAGTKGDQFVLCDCNQIMREVQSSLGLIIEETGAELTVEPLPEVYADRIQLAQVLQNLVNNAIKFQRECTPPKITITCTTLAEFHQFSVEDNGIGIEEKFFDRIFTLFQRLHGAQFDGTGLGLSICKRMIDRHRGQMWVESTVGKGSIFHFTIPIEPPTLSDGVNMDL
ncbi:MAG: PAS domain S-box-containing protein [Candidatus Omnitrophota bacterium]|jgi:PAS domain S-box-containing protein